MKGAKKKPEVTPQLIEACKRYAELEAKQEKLSKEENRLWQEQKPYSKLIQRFAKKHLPKLRGITVKAGQYKIRVSSGGWIRKVS